MSKNETSVSEILDALMLAKKATEFMLPLPKHMKPSHIRVLHTIYKNQNKEDGIRVTDISTAMGITKPSITKLINELDQLDAIIKSVSTDDKRVVMVELTPLGKKCVQKYVLDYHMKLSKYFSKIEDEKYSSFIEVINFIHESMEKVYREDLD